jgi:hypothetical protein
LLLTQFPVLLLQLTQQGLLAFQLRFRLLQICLRLLLPGNGGIGSSLQGRKACLKRVKLLLRALQVATALTQRFIGRPECLRSQRLLQLLPLRRKRLLCLLQFMPLLFQLLGLPGFSVQLLSPVEQGLLLPDHV